MIAERATVSIATVYNHFPGSTSEIYIEVGNRLVDSAAEATRKVLEREGPVVAAEFLPVAVCSQVAKFGAGCFDVITSRQVGGSAFFGDPPPEATMFEFLVAAGLDADERTQDAARTIAYLIRGVIFSFASHATTGFTSEIATTEDELMSVAASAVRQSLALLDIQWPPSS
jgi:AcrR family transcriptional regulator